MSIPAQVERIGADACDAADTVLDDVTYLVRYVPEQPLIPGAKYQLDCEDIAYPQFLRVREDDSPAASPPLLEIASARYSRHDDGCCATYGDTVDVHFTELDHPFLDEGGYIEVRYTSGELFALAYLSAPGSPIELPGTRDIITFTPVSASGERGEPVRLDAGDIKGDLVYIACNIDTRLDPFALWLLVPCVWIGARKLRRPRRAA